MSEKVKWGAFALMTAFMLGLPSWMILSRERVLKEGEVFHFRTGPIDPIDPFRGEYVRLRFEAASGDWEPITQRNEVLAGARAWGELETDEDGFARIARLTSDRERGVASVEVTYSALVHERVIGIDLPFDRFYLQQGKGPRTESLLAGRASEGREALPAYAVVRVLNGQAVIEDLVVGDRSLHEWFMDE